MRTRQEVLDFGMTFPEVYIDTPFRDTNWVLLRCKKNKKASPCGEAGKANCCRVPSRNVECG